jgi:hypothetical protein
MAQGSGKLGAKKAAKSKGSLKHKVIKGVAKGRLQKKPRRAHQCDEAIRIQQETTKAINRKNERIIAAKAVSVGTKFFLSDVAEKGTNHIRKQTAERNKRQLKSKTTTSRMEQQIQNLKK